MWSVAAKLALPALGTIALAGLAVNPGASPGSGPGTPAVSDARQFTDDAVRLGFSHRAQAAFPAKLAVYEHITGDCANDVRDNESIEAIVALLREEKKFYQTVVLAPPVLTGDASPTNLRRAAAAHRADLVLLLESDFRTSVRPSLLSLLDLTVVGAYVFRSWGVELESRVTAHLFDTRNGLAYHSTVKEERWEGSASFARRGDVVDTRRRELALKNLTEAIEDVRANLEHAERLAKEPVADPPVFGTWSAVPRRPDPPPPARALPALGASPDGVRYDTAGQER